jgi:uncharacterized protein YbbC (DUF1343 family)
MLKLLPVALGVVLVLAPLSARSATVEVGIDVLASKDFDLLKGKRVAVVTNHTGLNAAGTHLVPLLIENKVQLVKLFSPEHGLYGLKDEHVGDGIDEKTGLPVFSLYGGKDKRKPNADQLNGVDVLVFDIQDIGTRFYTYISTMGLCMEACAENKVKFVVLDRPNPINGTRVDGAINDEKHSGFTAYRKLPLVHGMTVGELAQLFNEEFDIHCDLTVVPMTGWKRSMYWEETGVKWVNPSPNMRSVTQAILYPAIGQLESSNLSVGRGTETPFELIGAPYVDSKQLADALTKLNLPGIAFEAVPPFTPRNTPHVFNNKQVNGVAIKLTDRDAFKPALTGMAMAWTLHNLYPEQWEWQKVRSMMQNDDVVDALFKLDDPSKAEALFAKQVEEWKSLRAKYLIYKD